MAPGRFHHVTYALDSREEILRAADILLANGSISKPARTGMDPADVFPLGLDAAS
jgi:hypothetical protein